ncbi:hypothetical protein ACRXCV_10275 [Halobacteriovorax sp. GFR7]|uniref:hypothetical protein n=1 Tax=unclassified Halobacteriovorax TaxID=2639665 RepID=UPI003D992D4A
MKLYLFLMIFCTSISAGNVKINSQGPDDAKIIELQQVFIECNVEDAATDITCEYFGDGYFDGSTAIWKINNQSVEKPVFKVSTLKDRNVVELFKKTGDKIVLGRTYIFYKKHIGINLKNGFKDIPNVVYFRNRSFKETIELKYPLDTKKANVEIYLEEKLIDKSGVSIQSNQVTFDLIGIENKANVKLVYREGDYKSELYMTYIRGDGRVKLSKDFEGKTAYISFVEEEIERWTTVSQKIIDGEVRNLFDGNYFIFIDGDDQLGRFIQVKNGKAVDLHKLTFKNKDYSETLKYYTLDSAPAIQGESYTYKSGTKVIYEKINSGDYGGLSIPLNLNHVIEKTLLFVVVKSSNEVKVHPYDLSKLYAGASDTGLEVNTIVEKGSDVFISYWYFKNK